MWGTASCQCSRWITVDDACLMPCRSISSLGSLEEEESLPPSVNQPLAIFAAANKLLEADPYLRATGQVCHKNAK